MSVDLGDLTSLEEAEQRRLVLIEEIESIQTQLGDHGFDERGGYRHGSLAEYELWRRKAKTALRYRHADLRALNGWIRAERTARGT